MRDPGQRWDHRRWSCLRGWHWVLQLPGCLFGRGSDALCRGWRAAVCLLMMVMMTMLSARPTRPMAAAPPALPCPAAPARAGTARGPECACAARGGWFERGGAAMAGPGPGRSARALQRRCPQGPAGVRRGRGGRPAGRRRRHRKAISSSPRPWSVRRDGGWGACPLPRGPLWAPCCRVASARPKWGLNRPADLTGSCCSYPWPRAVIALELRCWRVVCLSRTFPWKLQF